MPDSDLARRTLLRSSFLLPGLLVPGVAEALQHMHDAAQSGMARTAYLSASDAAEIEALAGEIIPSDDTPGAKEAGAIYFIDRALATFDSDKREVYRRGMEAARGERKKRFPGSASLAALTSPQRIEILQAIEKTPFFEALRVHTIISFLADPRWGGNREKAGWKLIGFDDQWVFQPPFGYYDQPGNAE